MGLFISESGVLYYPVVSTIIFMLDLLFFAVFTERCDKLVGQVSDNKPAGEIQEHAYPGQPDSFIYKTWLMQGIQEFEVIP